MSCPMSRAVSRCRERRRTSRSTRCSRASRTVLQEESRSPSPGSGRSRRKAGRRGADETRGPTRASPSPPQKPPPSRPARPCETWSSRTVVGPAPEGVTEVEAADELRRPRARCKAAVMASWSDNIDAVARHLRDEVCARRLERGGACLRGRHVLAHRGGEAGGWGRRRRARSTRCSR